MTACIVGWSHTVFGKHEDDDVESLILKVATAAVEDAGLGPEDIDEILLGTYNEGFSPQGFPGGITSTHHPIFAGKVAEKFWR